MHNDAIIEVYDADQNLLPVTRSRRGDIETLEMAISMPNTLIINVEQAPLSAVKITDLKLIGLKIQTDLLPNLLEFKANATLDNHATCDSIKDTEWVGPGIGVLDIFDVEPFAFLLHIGNRISI